MLVQELFNPPACDSCGPLNKGAGAAAEIYSEK